MIIDNTTRMQGGVLTPVSQLRARGLMGLGAGWESVPWNASSPSSTSSDMTSVMTAINSEIAFLTNLYNQQTGKPLLQYSPMAPYSVGVNPNMLMLGAAGLLAILLLKRRR